MKIVCSFVTKFASLISWVHACFDRVIYKGHLPISRLAEFEKLVDHVLKIYRVDFLKVVGPKWSKRVVEHAQEFAKKHGRIYEYYSGSIDKDAWAKEQLDKSPVKEGLVGVLCVMETCRTFKIAHGKYRPCFVFGWVPQRVLYYYFIDRDLGFMHVRLQTWAPFTIQVYANGHEYVARQLKKKGISFEQVDNAFVELGDPAAAQRGPLCQVALAEDARTLRPASQSVAPGRTQGVEPLLGRRPSRVRHGSALCQQARLGGVVLAFAGIRLAYFRSQENFLLSGT
jgi:hypothetical protein